MSAGSAFKTSITGGDDTALGLGNVFVPTTTFVEVSKVTPSATLTDTVLVPPLLVAPVTLLATTTTLPIVKSVNVSKGVTREEVRMVTVDVGVLMLMHVAESALRALQELDPFGSSGSVQVAAVAAAKTQVACNAS